MPKNYITYVGGVIIFFKAFYILHMFGKKYWFTGHWNVHYTTNQNNGMGNQNWYIITTFKTR